MNEVTLYLHEIILIKVGEKPISKYNHDHKIPVYFIDKVVTEIDHYPNLNQIRLWFETATEMPSITFYNPTYSIEND